MEPLSLLTTYLLLLQLLLGLSALPDPLVSLWLIDLNPLISQSRLFLWLRPKISGKARLSSPSYPWIAQF